jgi:hypothetical protein
MGREKPAASKKSSRNEGLPLFPAISLAIFGPNNPAQPPAGGHLPQHQAALRQREILTFSRFAADRRLAKSANRPFEALPARWMVSSADGLYCPAEQACLHACTQPPERRPVEAELIVDFQDVHRGPG